MKLLLAVSGLALLLAAPFPPSTQEEEDEPPPPAEGERASGDAFTPTEQLRHDQEVDFPVDI